LIVSNQVHEAVNQCLNYLRALDEVGAALQTHYKNELDLELDFRRARGTVIIGHPGRISTASVTKEQIDQTVRSYNAHLSRLTVRTYADVLDSAERSLRFASEGTAVGQAELGR
jgi:predicted transcriptional regulator